MPTDLGIVMDNRPGTLAEIGEALGRAGINVEGMCGFVAEGKGVGHILVADPTAARQALDGLCEVGEEREVLVVEIEDRPGALGGLARKLSDAGVNVEVAYLGTGTRLVLAVSDIEKARTAL
ncbi:MAG TPA: ACT domain-containing protein [Actinomycetota bacterium]|nr:ACT domain-containing protein [Actinomycetota bacterium]